MLVARREDELERTAATFSARFGVDVQYVTLDLTTHGNREALSDTTRERGFNIDYLSNNVGIGTQGHFLETDFDRELD